jgi:uncharacterized protein DUF955
MSVRIPPPEEFAKALLRRVGVNRPSDMADFARVIGLRIVEVESNGFDGALIRIPYKPRGIIAVRSAIRELGRKRFTIAHEIGHYILPGHGTSESICKDQQIESLNGSSGSHEAAANRFASELLLPAEQIIPIIKANSVDIKTARAISDDFQTSLTAAARKCVELADESCAFVVSVDGVVRHCKASKSWRYQMPMGCELGYGTLARRLAAGDGTRHERMEINALAWVMSQGTDPRGADLIEDSILLPNYNTVLSILTAVVP